MENKVYYLNCNQLGIPNFVKSFAQLSKLCSDAPDNSIIRANINLVNKGTKEQQNFRPLLECDNDVLDLASLRYTLSKKNCVLQIRSDIKRNYTEVTIDFLRKQMVRVCKDGYIRPKIDFKVEFPEQGSRDDYREYYSKLRKAWVGRMMTLMNIVSEKETEKSSFTQKVRKDLWIVGSHTVEGEVPSDDDGAYETRVIEYFKWNKVLNLTVILPAFFTKGYKPKNSATVKETYYSYISKMNVAKEVKIGSQTNIVKLNWEAKSHHVGLTKEIKQTEDPLLKLKSRIYGLDYKEFDAEDLNNAIDFFEKNGKGGYILANPDVFPAEIKEIAELANDDDLMKIYKTRKTLDYVSTYGDANQLEDYYYDALENNKAYTLDDEAIEKYEEKLEQDMIKRYSSSVKEYKIEPSLLKQLKNNL